MEIDELITTDIGQAADIFESLKITQLTRPTPVEVLFDLVTYYQSTGSRLMENMYTWTSRRDSDGDSVTVGQFDNNGMHICGPTIKGQFIDHGAWFSRIK